MTYSPLANPRATRDMLNRFGLSAKHALGQNFLIDDHVVGKILKLADLLPSEGEPQVELPTVIEIGPGIGTLTSALLEHASVVSVERDKDLIAPLSETTAFNSDRFALIQGDALKAEREDIAKACDSIHAGLPGSLVANLPYSIAATVILDWIERFEFLDSMVIMVQSEVADRISAETGTKEYGAYTVKLAQFAKVTGRFQVPPTCFSPAPHVESAVIRLDRIQTEETGDDSEVMSITKATCKVAEAAFAQRRKTIRNSMKSVFPTQTVDELLEAVEVDPRTRAETLSPETFRKMGASLLELRQE